MVTTTGATDSTMAAPTRRLGAVPLSVWGVALLLPVGPAAIAVLRLVLPYYTASDTEGVVEAVAANPGQQSAVLWLAYIGILTLVPGLFAAAGVCRAAAPRLTAWALALSVPGYLSLGMFVGSDHLLWSTHEAGLSVVDSVAVVSATHPSVDVAIGVFVIGHVVGTVLLGLALLRSRRIPAWAAWAVAVSQPLHFVATVILGSPQVDFVAWMLTAVGMAAVARELVRASR
jgi:hypothetical protein